MKNPLWMPEGSVRALLILMFSFTACMLVSTNGIVPREMWTLIGMGIAFYTGMKVGNNAPKQD